ncbi:MAG: diguanylate cyclase [Gammaproteobacteria bacterium]|nr:diguanylate cyclase [Gammaproteobacteria bacterium]
MHQLQSPWIKRITLNTGTALLYLLFAQLGMLLAIEPGNISVFWPPAAIALAAVLLFGRGLGFGVFAGEFLVNTQLYLNSMESDPFSSFLMMAFSSSLGVTLQALLGAYLIHRFVDFEAGLTRFNDVLRVMLLGGPIACLVSATWGNLSLLMSGQILQSAFTMSWLTWWFGDTVGVLVLLPLLLALLAKPRPLWNQRNLAISIPVLTTLIVTLFIHNLTEQEQQLSLNSQFEQKATRLADALEKKLVKNIEVLYSVQNLFNSNGVVDRDLFDSYVQRSLERNTDIQALGWNPVILKHQRDDFESSVRAEGYPDFAITERNAEGELVTAKAYDKHVTVKYIVPLTGNEKAFGYDIYSNQSRREALDKATQSGELVATASITLVQETGNQAGILFMLPVYDSASVPPYNQRNAQLRGFTVGVYRLGDLVAKALENFSESNLEVSLSDHSHADDPLAYFTYDRNGQGALVTEKTDAMMNPSLQWQTTLNFGQREWHFKVFATTDYLVQNRHWASWFVLITGLIFTALIGFFTMVMTGRNILDQENLDNLAHEIEHRQQIENELQAANDKLEKLATTDPLTGVHNRRSIEHISQMLDAEVKRYQDHYVVFMLDIDHFKKVNDQFGHKVGDQILITLTQAIQQQLRDTDYLGRWGGEEFVIIAKHIQIDESVDFAQRIVDSISSMQIEPVGRITISIGVASLESQEQFEAVLLRADSALYQAKERGRNQVVISDPSDKKKGATMIQLKPR